MNDPGAVADQLERARQLARTDPHQALQLAEEARMAAEAAGDLRLLALAGRACGVASWSSGDWSGALEHLRSGEAAARELGDVRLAAQVPILGIEILARLGRPAEALNWADRLLADLPEDPSAAEDRAKILANTGNVEFQREEYGRALRAWEQALAYFQMLGADGPEASLRINIANVLTHLNRIPEARNFYREARAALERLNQRVVVAGVDGNLGYLNACAGDYPQALMDYHAARSGFTALGLDADVARCNRELSDLYRQLNLLQECRTCAEAARPQLEQLGSSSELAQSDLGLAELCRLEGRGDDAQEWLARARARYQTESNRVGLARCSLIQAEWLLAGNRELRAEATALAREAQRTARREGLVTLGLHARLLELESRVGQSPPPDRALRGLARKYQSNGLVHSRWRVLAVLARSLSGQGKRRAAVGTYRAAVREIEQARELLRGDELRMALVQARYQIYVELMELLLESGSRGSLVEALGVLDSARARTLLERLTGPLRLADVAERSAPPEVARLLQRLDELSSQLTRLLRDADTPEDPRGSRRSSSELPAELRAAEQEQVQVLRQLQLHIPASVRDPHPHSALTEVLRPGEAVVEFGSVRDEVLAFVIRRGSVRLVRGLASVQDVTGLVDRLQRCWSRARHGGGPAASHGARRLLRVLREQLLSPLIPYLGGRHLTVIPFGPLTAVPFHALELEDGRPAQERWEIRWSPSASILVELEKRPTRNAERSLLIGSGGEDLPRVGEEIRRIRRLVHNAEVRLEAEAGVESVPRSAVLRYLHLAAHGWFRPDNPAFSGLRLHDGWILAHEIQRRKLECDVAVLAACHSGSVSRAPGEELLGLPRSFLEAGARSTIVSLWEADDTASAFLMQRLYSGLQQGRRPAAALREAQRAMRRRFPDPYFWAPFVAIGAR